MSEQNPTLSSVTGSGGKLDFLWPSLHRFEIADIARGMSNSCLLGGQVKTFYSRAQHCVLMAKLVPAECEREAMLFYAARAFCGDLGPVLEWHLPEYREIVQLFDTAIREQFDLPPTPSAPCVIASKMILGAAYRDLMPPGALPKGALDGVSAHNGKIVAAQADRAHGMWASRWMDLQGQVARAA